MAAAYRSGLVVAATRMGRGVLLRAGWSGVWVSLSYEIRYWLSWIIGAAAVIAGVLAASIALPSHPSWLTTDVAGTAGIVAAICAGLLTRLPETQRTPATREAAYLSASVGVLPDDLAKVHPEVASPPTTPGEPPLHPK